MNANEPHQWKINIGSGNSLLPNSTKPLPESMLTQIYGITRPQWIYNVICISHVFFSILHLIWLKIPWYFHEYLVQFSKIFSFKKYFPGNSVVFHCRRADLNFAFFSTADFTKSGHIKLTHCMVPTDIDKCLNLNAVLKSAWIFNQHWKLAIFFEKCLQITFNGPRNLMCLCGFFKCFAHLILIN